MALRKHVNIPAKLHADDREVVAFLQRLLDQEPSLVPVGADISWRSTVLPNDNYVFKAGQVLLKADYLALWTYAQNDATYTTTATDMTLPVLANVAVRAK